MRHPRLLTALALSGVTLLSGCGVAGTQFHPGLAAQVGDETITSRHVDQVTDQYCQAIERVTGEQGAEGQSVPFRYLAHEFATNLVIEAAAKQIAAQYDVQPGESYQTALANLETQLTTLTSGERRAVLDVEGAQAYYQDVLTQVGGIELGDPSAADQDKADAGQQVLDDWFKSNDVEVNPKYAFSYGTPTQVDTDTSVAVSTAAKQGLEAQPADGYTSSLPDRLVCGD